MNGQAFLHPFTMIKLCSCRLRIAGIALTDRSGAATNPCSVAGLGHREGAWSGVFGVLLHADLFSAGAGRVTGKVSHNGHGHDAPGVEFRSWSSPS
jgi:hypothetical protein